MLLKITRFVIIGLILLQTVDFKLKKERIIILAKFERN